jgi:nucleoid-associated protein YgaU
VNLTLQEVSDKEKKGGQNPTSLGSAGIRDHRVVAGETLDVIAYNELGNANHWRYIAELNNIANPFDLKPGRHLAIAPPP